MDLVNKVNKPISSTFAEIKQGLDPACTYMIFEKPERTKKSIALREILSTFSLLKKEIFEHEFYHDEVGGKYYLVVKLDTDETDSIKQELLNSRLPKEIAFYVYENRPEMHKVKPCSNK